jgi:hypothetical protein
VLRVVEYDGVQDRFLKYDLPGSMVDERHGCQFRRHRSEDGSDTLGNEDAPGAFLTSMRLDSISGEAFDDDVEDGSGDVIKWPCAGWNTRTIGDAGGCSDHDGVYMLLWDGYLTM